MDDQVQSNLNSQVTSMLNNWAQEYGIFIKQYVFREIYCDYELNKS